MSETDYDLAIDRSVTLGANGTGTIDGVGPTQYGERWEITSIQTQVDGSALETELRIMQDGRSRVIAGTYSGNLDTSDSKIPLMSGQKLYFEYSKGTPGAIGRIAINGRRYVQGRRAY